MAIAHCCILRTLNCIYLQAPNIKKEKDINDFVVFMGAWSEALHTHHQTEEELTFPMLEEYIGIPGFMEKNIEQHHAFGPGIAAYEEYLKVLREGKENYDGAKVCSIIDSFGTILRQHLSDEIATLEALEEHTDKINWAEMNSKMLKHIQATLEMVGPRP